MQCSVWVKEVSPSHAGGRGWVAWMAQAWELSPGTADRTGRCSLERIRCVTACPLPSPNVEGWHLKKTLYCLCATSEMDLRSTIQ